MTAGMVFRAPYAGITRIRF